MPEVGVGLGSFEDTDAETFRKLGICSVQLGVGWEQPMLGEANCTQRNGVARRRFEILLGRYVRVRRELRMNVQIDQHKSLRQVVAFQKRSHRRH